MSSANANLPNVCRKTADAAAQAVTWFDDNPTLVKLEHASLVREFRKFAFNAKKLTIAVERPMCVGVFGPSQAGKSYLISAFARNGTQPLIADFDGLPEGLDFVRQINPEGGAESTGLVTRFTIRRKPAPSGFPVPVRILTQADIVKIIGNSFFSDCDLSEEKSPDAAAINKLGTQAKAAAQATALPGLTQEEVWDIQDYFERQFKGQLIVRDLSAAGYWTLLADHAPRLPLASRAALLAPLWGGIEGFTALYLKLTGALERLGFAEDAFCPIEALVARDGDRFMRRSDSVIDVTTLQGLGHAEEPTLDMRGASGSVATLPRPVVTALIAELHVTMHERPWDFLENTDLLDFPGARSRDNIKDVATYLKTSETSREGRKDGALGGLEGLFLRGKVAYLFERYNADQELTSMLLCIAPSNQEVRTVPGMVKDWIDVTHGPDPQTRAMTDTALFFVLTKFDAEFEEAAGKSDDSTARWTRRLTTSLVDFFGKAHSWPHEWTPGRAFDNCFWLRNPNFKAKHILDYDENSVELAIRPSEVKRIDQQRSEYLTNEVVRRHFRDPATAWDEAFRLNDGGITHLAQSVAPVCNPVMKQKQIAVRVDGLRKTMRERLARYYISDDLSVQRDQRLVAARDVVRALITCASEQKFGGLIRRLQTSDAELGDVFVTLVTQGGLPTGRRIDTGALWTDFDIEDAGQTADAIRDAADAFADAAVKHWIEAIRLISSNARVCSHFKIAEKTMSDLVDELIAGAARCGLRQRVAGNIRPFVAEKPSAKEIVQPALLAANAIGAFVFWLGYDATPDTERPLQRGASGLRIFAPTPRVDVPVLEERPSSFDERFYRDWLTGYMDFVKRNSESLAGRQIDIEQNARIGTILKGLGSEAFAQAAE